MRWYFVCLFLDGLLTSGCSTPQFTVCPTPATVGSDPGRQAEVVVHIPT